MATNLVAQLRRDLLARGFTRLPVCRTCRFERSVNDFGESGQCLYCEREADFAAAKQEARTGHHAPPVSDMISTDERDYE